MALFELQSCSNIQIPFDIVPTGADCGKDIESVLRFLFPRKYPHMCAMDHTRLSVRFRTGDPFGPGPGVLCDSLFPELKDDVLTVRDRFGLKSIEISGLGEEKVFEEEKVVFSPQAGKGDAVQLTALEFRRLAVLCRERKLEDSVLLSVFLTPDNIFSFFLPIGKKISEVFDAREEIKSFISEHPGTRAYHPVTGKMYDIETDIACPDNSLVTFTGTGYVLSPANTGIFGFPWFGKKASMRRLREQDRKEYPCSNCLKCVDVCPSGIDPSLLYHHLRADNVDEALGLGLECCTRCGLCSFVCPSDIDLYGGLTKALDYVEAERAGEVVR
ncbi:MAG: hypothetical protein KAV42_00970 [Candidatus Krumholzibacteria bacterium]|nr:hypothetical protein [Candidatus Krumholzibacteria bacterium]